VRDIYPMAYHFNIVQNLEMGVGIILSSGRAVVFLLHMHGNKIENLFWNGMFLVGLYFLQFMLSIQMRKMDQFVEVVALTDGDIKEQMIEDIGGINASEYDNVQTERLFK